MLDRRPALTGLLFGSISHIGIWLVFWFVTYMLELPDAAFVGCTIVLVLLLGLFGYFVWRAKRCILFVLGATSSAAVLFIVELIVFANFGSVIIPYLDRSDWFAGLSYLIFFIFMAISLVVEWMIALALWLIRRNKTTSMQERID